MSSTEATRLEPTRLQRAVARRMTSSHTEVPDFALEVDVDMEAAVEWRSQRREEGESPPSYNAIVIRASARALVEHPKANGSWVEDAFVLHPSVDIGVAVATDDALIVPIVRDANQLSVSEISSETRRLALAVKERRIAADELNGGTFTVSNLGMYGVDRFNAMVNPPQAAILAVGAMRRRPAACGDEVGLRHMMTLTLSCDHRILYGAEGAEFLASIRDWLVSPHRLDVT